MKCFTISRRRVLNASALLTFAMVAVPNVLADKPKASGQIDFSDTTMTQATFTLGGTEKQIGRYTSYGELDFVASEDEGTLNGSGVVVLTAANGDLLVGAATSQLNIANGQADFHFSWRDSITLRDGTTVSNTGKFLKHRPPGLVVIATAEQQSNIITILIRIILGR
jgi:hypothetical protein